MKQLFYIALLLLSFTSLLTSCGDGTVLMKNVTGKPGELVVVAPDNLWESAVGDSIFELLSQPQPMLPQEEPIFDVAHVPNKGFTDIFKTTRNLVLIQVGSNVDSTKFTIRENVWAAPQVVMTIHAKTKEEYFNILKKNKNLIPNYFTKSERKRIQSMYSDRKFKEKVVESHVEKKFGIKMATPKGFRVATDTTDFSWILFRARDLDQGIFVYTTPYTSEKDFSKEVLVKRRNDLLKKYVPGPREGSYMRTIDYLEPTYRSVKLNGNYTIEMRGLWNVVNYSMGGPWMSLSTLDLANRRIITVEGWVYAPEFDKLTYMRQMDAMLYSTTLVNQEDNDKLNKMMNLDTAQ